MSRIKGKYIGDNEITETKVRLSNDTGLRSRNAADSADVDIIKLNASDLPDLGSKQLQNVADPTNPQDAATKNSSEAYTPANSGDWAGDPTTVKQALDRLAAAVAAFIGNPIP